MKKISMTLAAMAVIFCMVACEDNTKPETPGNGENTENPDDGGNTENPDDGGNTENPDKPDDGGNNQEPEEPAGIIAIDGQFSDWDAFEVAATHQEGNPKDGIQAMKLAADDKYIYLYFEFLPATFEKAGTSLTIYLDDDNNAETGADTAGWYVGCFRYMMQSAIYGANGFVSYDPNVKMFTGEDKTAYWADVNANNRVDLISAGQGFSKGAGAETADAIYYECALTREYLETLEDTIALGVYISSNVTWGEIGVLPRAAGDTPAEFLTIDLPAAE